jgi:nitrogen-specific signal transduction histidine kinase
LVHKIITEHLGNIKVESQENSGTAFTVMLPQYKGEATKYLEAKP